MTEAAQHELEKYRAIYAGEGPPSYGHSNHGKDALAIVTGWKPESLLDVGCGWNEFCRQASAAGIPATGVDFACPGADVIADAVALPFETDAFDVLTAFDMLEHVLPAQVDTVLAEFARVSKRFIFSISYVPSKILHKGENLHPTVQPESWWIRQIMRAGGIRIVKRGRYITGEWQTPLRIDPQATVCLVGNGPSVLQCSGAEIDAHDVVIRFNNYQLGPHAEHTGTKTTHWSTFGHGVLPGDAQRPESVIFTHGENLAPAYTPKHLYRIPRYFYESVRRTVQDRSRWLSGFRNITEHLLGTSGLTVACWLLDVVGVECVTLAGFDHFSKESSKQHHYYNPGTFGKPKEHDGDAEAAMFAELEAAGRVKYLGRPSKILNRPSRISIVPGGCVHYLR